MEFELEDDLPEGFKPYYRNRMPHYDPRDAPYFTTYRLNGSVPKSEIQRLYEQFRNAKTAEDKLAFFRAYDEVLDKNGPYHLQRPDARGIVMESLEYLSGNELDIHAYTIMPNHVHAVFNVIDSEKPLFRIMQSHKRHTAREINKILGSTGTSLWHPETYDHVVREGRLGSAIWYTLLNPVKAKLVKDWRDWPGTYLSPNCQGFG